MNNNYYYDTQAASAAGGILAGFGVMWFIMMAASIFLLVCMYKVFKKAGRKGWEALIPIYNFIVMIQIAELPMWYIALYFIPIANIYAMFKIYIEFAHKFGKSTGFGIAMVFFSYICFPILAFGNAQYQGSIPMNNNYNPMPNNNMIPNQNFGMNNGVDQNNNSNIMSNNLSGVSNELNNNLQPEVQSIPVSMTPVNEVQTSPVIETPEVPVVPVATPVPEVVPTMPVEETPMMQTPAVSEPIAPVEPTVNPMNKEQEVNQPTINQNDKKFCPQCGNQVDQNDAMCFMCGHQF